MFRSGGLSPNGTSFVKTGIDAKDPSPDRKGVGKMPEPVAHARGSEIPGDSGQMKCSDDTQECACDFGQIRD
jgi:hypothetical protein